MGAKKKSQVTVYTILTAMCDDGLLTESIGYNELAGMPYVRGELPWDERRAERPWNDADLSSLYAYLQTTANIGRSKSELLDALNVFLADRRYHPVREWLGQLPEWDGTPRVTTLLQDFLGAEGGAYVASVTWLMMLGAIHRVMEPACKLDVIVTLQGRQGIKKSSFVRMLSPRDEWVLERVPDMTRAKELAESLRGKWICELAELDGLSGRDVNSIKAVISQRVDTYRAPYARYTKDQPRQCVFIGTCNDTGFLNDLTGNRRFLIVECGRTEPSLDPLRPPQGYMTQVWAEAYDYYRKQQGRVQLYLNADMEHEAEALRESYLSSSDEVAKIREWLRHHTGEPVCASMVTEQVLFVERSSAAYNRTRRMVVKILDNQCPNWERARTKTHKLRLGSYGVTLAWCYYDPEEDGQHA